MVENEWEIARKQLFVCFRVNLQAQFLSSQRHPRHLPVALRKSEVCWRRRNSCKFAFQSHRGPIFLRSVDKDGRMIILVELVYHPSGNCPLGWYTRMMDLPEKKGKNEPSQCHPGKLRAQIKKVRESAAQPSQYHPKLLVSSAWSPAPFIIISITNLLLLL